jgi:hypothetical protein
MQLITDSRKFQNDNYFYHGTDLYGFDLILESKKLCVEYNDCNGIYLTNSFDRANQHGCFVFAIDKKYIDRNKFESQDNDEDIFYIDSIDLHSCDILVDIKNDRRVVECILKNMLQVIIDREKVFNSNLQG